MKVNPWLAAIVLASPVWSQDEVPAPFDEGDVTALSSEEPTRFDPDSIRPKMVQVTVEWVELSHEKLTELMFLSEPASSDATSLRRQVAEMVKAKEAKVLETAMVVARSGEKAATDSTSEFIYPTDYHPGTIAEHLHLGGLDGDEANAESLGRALSSAITPQFPTAFQTRNLGTALEVAPNIGGESDRDIDINLAPEIVWHTGNTVWLETKDGLGNTHRVEMPQVYSLEVRTAITCIDGQYNLIAIQSPKNQNGRTDFTRKVMVFVRCDVQVVKEGE